MQQIWELRAEYWYRKVTTYPQVVGAAKVRVILCVYGIICIVEDALGVNVQYRILGPLRC